MLKGFILEVSAKGPPPAGGEEEPLESLPNNDQS
jgi:hypothetical protein